MRVFTNRCGHFSGLLEDHCRITDPGHNVLGLGGPVPARARVAARLSDVSVLSAGHSLDSAVIQCSNHIPQCSLVVALPCDCEVTPTRPWRVGVSLRFPAHDYRGADLPPLLGLQTY